MGIELWKVREGTGIIRVYTALHLSWLENFCYIVKCFREIFSAEILRRVRILYDKFEYSYESQRLHYKYRYWNVSRI